MFSSLSGLALTPSGGCCFTVLRSDMRRRVEAPPCDMRTCAEGARLGECSVTTARRLTARLTASGVGERGRRAEGAGLPRVVFGWVELFSKRGSKAARQSQIPGRLGVSEDNHGGQRERFLTNSICTSAISQFRL